MKITLVDPLLRHNKTRPSLAIGYLAAVLSQAGHNVNVIDFISNNAYIAKKESNFLREETKFLKKVQNASTSSNIVGVTGWSGVYPRMLKVAKTVKTTNPESYVVFGGPHVTFTELSDIWHGEIFKDSPYVDALAIGEGENTINLLVSSIQKNKRIRKIPGLSFRRGKKIFECRKTDLIDDLDASPFPLWSIFDMTQYSPVVFVSAARSCIYNCAFCDERHLWGRYRYRSAENIVEEISSNKENYGFSRFRFADSCLTSYPELINMCEIIKKKRLRVNWTCYGRVNEVDEKRLMAMKRAGCVCICLGVESGDDTILTNMQKGFLTNDIKTAVNIAKKVGIKVRGSFIIGFPGETVESAEKTIEFADSLSLDGYAWHTFFPPFKSITRELFSKAKWRDYYLDLPDGLLLRYLERSPFARTEIHNVVRTSKGKMIFDNGKIPIYSSISYFQMQELVRKAIRRTEDKHEMDFDLLKD